MIYSIGHNHFLLVVCTTSEIQTYYHSYRAHDCLPATLRITAASIRRLTITATYAATLSVLNILAIIIALF